MQTLSSPLFSVNCIISGDTNNGNWGLRENGELVLFDWERFGFGCPTIDLAPLVGGMGTAQDYEQVIESYSASGAQRLPDNPVKHLVLAKAWIAVEVINILNKRNKPQKSQYIEWFNTKLPTWLRTVGNAL